MGRRRQNTVYRYFSFNKETNYSTCLIPGCKLKVKGQHGANLLRHLAPRHFKEYTIVQKRNQLLKNEMENNKRLLHTRKSDNNDNEGTSEKPNHYNENELIQMIENKMEDHNLIYVNDDPLARAIEKSIVNDKTSEKNNVKEDVDDTINENSTLRYVKHSTSPPASLQSVYIDHKKYSCFTCKNFYNARGNTDEGNKHYGDLIASELKHVLPCMRTHVYVEILKLIQRNKYEHINSDDDMASMNE